jgi:hypothetical protein
VRFTTPGSAPTVRLAASVMISALSSTMMLMMGITVGNVPVRGVSLECISGALQQSGPDH